MRWIARWFLGWRRSIWGVGIHVDGCKWKGDDDGYEGWERVCR